MAVDVQVSPGLHRQIDQAVARQRLEHVVEEPDAGLDPGLTPAVQIYPDAEIGLFGGSGNLADTGHDVRVRSSAVGGKAVQRQQCRRIRAQARMCSRALITISMSSGVPIETRRHCVSSGEAETSRTRIPYSS
jgi:hypothetical protein